MQDDKRNIPIHSVAIGQGHRLFSAPEPKAQVHYCDHALSVVRPSVVNFSHFRLLLWNHWTEFNETWQEARTQHPLPSLCFSGRSEKQDGRRGLWLAETFLTSLKPLNGIQRNLIGCKISTSSTKFVFFGPIGKTRWPPWPLIGWDIFDFSSETTERNSTKLDRKQDLNVFYQICVFRVDRKKKMAALASDWLRHFRLLLRNRWTEFNETWQEARSQRPLPILCYSIRSEKTRWPPWPLIGWDIFDFSSETAEQNSTKLDRKQDLNVLYQVCVFRVDRKNKMLMAALASDWLRHFRLLLWNRWTEFNETWQEARSQRLLPSLCFSGRSVYKNVRLGQFLKKVAYCTQVHDMWPFGPLVLPSSQRLLLNYNYWIVHDRAVIVCMCVLIITSMWRDNSTKILDHGIVIINVTCVLFFKTLV